MVYATPLRRPTGLSEGIPLPRPNRTSAVFLNIVFIVRATSTSSRNQRSIGFSCNCSTRLESVQPECDRPGPVRMNPERRDGRAARIHPTAVGPRFRRSASLARLPWPSCGLAAATRTWAAGAPHAAPGQFVAAIPAVARPRGRAPAGPWGPGRTASNARPWPSERPANRPPTPSPAPSHPSDWPSNHPDDSRLRRAENQPDANLLAATGHHVGHHAVEADAGQQDGQYAEQPDSVAISQSRRSVSRTMVGKARKLNVISGWRLAASFVTADRTPASDTPSAARHGRSRAGSRSQRRPCRQSAETAPSGRRRSCRSRGRRFLRG